MVSTISVFHCTLMFINPARLFHDFQYVEWFVQRWMICNYDVVITIHNYYVEWFVHDLWYVECFALRWMICTKLNNLYLQRWMCFDHVERFALLLNDLYSSMKLPRNFLSHKNPHNEHCPIRNPSCEDSFNANCFGTNKKTDYL